jgi:hypothetical protein
VDELQRVLRVVLGFSQKWGAAMLGDDACVAKLADVVDHRQPAHHVILGELMKRVEVEMAEALMPALRLIILARSEAERLGRIEVEDVEAIGAVVNLDEQPLAPIPDPQHAILNLHLRASLVQLTEAHDRVAKHR